MARYEDRSLRRPGIRVIGKQLTFAKLFKAAGFILPDQRTMRRMKRAVEVGLGWHATSQQIRRKERKCKPTPLREFTLREYELKGRINEFGWPIPPLVRKHIEAVIEQFPEAEIHILAHPDEDPIVKVSCFGLSLMTMAWWRDGIKPIRYYPPNP